jgi:RNA polymerase sigma factor (sigma-70 family)
MGLEKHFTDPYGQPTRWSVIRQAVDCGQPEQAEAAWRFLIDRYREPVTKSIRRRVNDPNLARELADEFFPYVYEHQVLEKADRRIRPFRCFIQGVIRNYTLHALRARGVAHADIDDVDPQMPERASPAEVLEETDWAMAVLHNVLEKLVKKHPHDGMLLMRFYGLAPYAPASVEVLAHETQKKPNAVHQALHRARNALRELVFDEIFHMVSTPKDLDAEMLLVQRRLMDALPGIMSIEEYYERGATAKAD